MRIPALWFIAKSGGQHETRKNKGLRPVRG